MKRAIVLAGIGAVLVWALPVSATLFTINVQNTLFSPASRTIQVGDQIRWRWVSGGHTTTSNSPGWDKPINSTDTSYTHTFSQQGSFPYHCKIHSSMTGTITVNMVLDVTDEPELLPDGSGLSQNYPNPFNASTVVAYILAADSRVELTVYDILGRRVRQLASGFQTLGPHRIEWDANDDSGHPVATGVYFYRLETPTAAATRKMVLLR